MSDQAKLRGNAMKRSASYNGFNFGLPSNIDELKIEDSLLDSSAFSAEWSRVFHKQGGCGALIRSSNHTVDCSVSNGFEGVEKADVSLTELKRQEAVIEKDKARLEEEARLDASIATIHALETDLKRIKGEKAKLEGQGKETQDLLIKLEHQLRCANKELQRRENRVNQLVEERRSLEDYQIKSRSFAEEGSEILLCAANSNCQSARKAGNCRQKQRRTCQRKDKLQTRVLEGVTCQDIQRSYTGTTPGDQIYRETLETGTASKDPSQDEIIWEKAPHAVNGSQRYSKDSKPKTPLFMVQKVTREKFTTYRPDLWEKRQNVSKPARIQDRERKLLLKRWRKDRI
ncbi:hypothetical protein OS493_037348 [Desmophyllum pertusum]|uniref:Uncharacterized protein n=1 Tax=Desmophyllum pertusum TaxID=174260 RepID=A0A9W9YI72_9CNID|nr:hypothetical protein OS493_037348 [Desmophyllum pertusum]